MLIASTVVVGFGNYVGRPSVVKVAALNWEQSPEAPKPLLSWALDLSDPAAKGQEQTAYQVFVASSRDALDVDDPDVWDSGKIESKQMRTIPSEAKLGEHKTYWWKVRVWDNTDRASSWSESATTMASRATQPGTMPK